MGEGALLVPTPKTFNKEEKFFAAAQVWGESNTTLSGGSIEVDSLKFPETKVGFGKKANSLARSNFKRISCCTNSFALQKALKSPTLSLSNQMHLGFKVKNLSSIFGNLLQGSNHAIRMAQIMLLERTLTERVVAIRFHSVRI